MLTLKHRSKRSKQPPDLAAFLCRQVSHFDGEPGMPNTTHDLRIKNVRQLRLPDRVTRMQDVRRQADDRRTSTSAGPIGNVHHLVKARSAAPTSVGILQVWWARWLERRRFARALPLLADEVLEDYGLNRREARRLCRRPFWLA
jgi:uncharacterized protein YjiS (DUF1127 family)